MSSVTNPTSGFVNARQPIHNSPTDRESSVIVGIVVGVAFLGIGHASEPLPIISYPCKAVGYGILAIAALSILSHVVKRPDQK